MTLERRDMLKATLAGGLVAAFGVPVRAAARTMTAVVETTAGKVRGLREGPISAFRGIPYGADTAPRRFLAPVPAPAWSGVRDCFAFGHRPPQGSTGTGRLPADSPNRARALQIADTFKRGQTETGNESEDCLYLNVFTPDASARRRRPVMFWLHGGGFAIGSGGEEVYEGGVLAARGDVVVVTINHRLYAPGYLYLGPMHPDFADSGNAGQLDQVLALRWVRDNIVRFGGDPDNVTIFGESGGGSKVSCLLAMPAAKSLFHKAIIQSGAGLRMIEASDAAAYAEQVVKVLGIAPPEVHRLQLLPLEQVMKAAVEAERLYGPGKRTLAPVVDGRNLPSHPFDPVAPEISRGVPIIVGTTKDENTLFSAGDPQFGTMSAEQALARFRAVLGPRGDAAYELYSKARPGDAPTYWFTAMQTDNSAWINSIRLAERKARQGGAPVYMYRLDWETPIFGGTLRAPHGIDTPMVFGHADDFARILGGGPDPRRVSEQMMDAWIAFARTGNPSQRGLAWPPYELEARRTMIFDARSGVVADPDKAKRQFWSS